MVVAPSRPGATLQAKETSMLMSLTSDQMVQLARGADRTLFWKVFLDRHVPRCTAAQGDYHGLLEACMNIPTSPQSSLVYALNALSLVQLGSIDTDRRLIELARQNYAKALKKLRMALSIPQSLQDDHTLAAVMVLKFCELYTELASPQGIGWAGHVCAAERLLAERGPTSVRNSLNAKLLANAKHGTLCHSLVSRRASILAQPCWSALGDHDDTNDHILIFLELAIQIPGLLEQYDGSEIQHGDHIDIDQVDDLLSKAIAIEQNMRNWLERWSTAGRQYHSRPIEDFTTFATLCQDRTFTTAFAFSNFMAAYLQSVYWICMYFLRITIRGLHTARTVAVPGHIPSPDQDVAEEEILGYVADACRCIPYFCEPASSTMGCIGIFLPLRTAAFYFVDTHMWGPARWVGNVRNSCLNKGLAPPSIDNVKLSDYSGLVVGREDEVIL